MIIYDTEWGGLYDLDEATGQVSKVLKLIGKTESDIKFARFDYAMPSYKKATKADIKKWGKTYYLDDGSCPFNALGKWMEGNMPTYGGYKCSECGYQTVKYKLDICPSCKSKMHTKYVGYKK